MTEVKGALRDDWQAIHDELGCKGCKFVDEEALGKRPCCNYPGRIKQLESGRCDKKRGPALGC